MSDIYCAKCGEPWEAYGVATFDAMDEPETARFKNGDGCPCCGFGTRCPLCSGTGTDSEYQTCRECTTVPGAVLAWRPRETGHGYSSANWYTNYRPNVRTVGPVATVRKVRDEAGFTSRDGFVYQMWVACDKCGGSPDGTKCTRCDGSGKLSDDRDAVADTALAAARSECDASDADPIDILSRRGLI